MSLDQYQHKKPLSPIDLTVIGGSFLVYLLTTCPTVYLGDSGEFIASAFCLGNPHNSGYPLYVLIGKMFSMIPLSSVAFRLNLMSACFGSLAVWLTYRIIVRFTRSFASALSAALLLAFSATLWSQTTCAEVYAFHAFFVALIITLLFWWHETMSLDRLLVFAFVVGLSFGNHIQTVMLAPAVFTFIIWSNRRVLANVKNFFLLTFFFALSLSVYLYLPIRTEAGAAIHWGDPDTIGRFLHHVTASAHRHGYVLTKSWGTYGSRLVGALGEMFSQYYLFLVFAAIGWIREKDIRCKIFWVLIVLFDTTYTVFLNTISLEITAFQIPSSIVLAILIGKGLAYILEYCFTSPLLNRICQRCLKPAFVCFPVVLLTTNLYQNDQHTNYTAYEYGIDVMRSIPNGETLILGGDNTVFPVAYLRLTENARTDVDIYDRYNLIFKMPFLYKDRPTFVGKWEDLRRIIESELVKTRKYVYIAMFNEKAFSEQGFNLIPHGLTYRAVPTDKFESALREKTSPWSYYMAESVNSPFYRDYMNRSVTGYFFLKMGRNLILMGKQSLGMKMLKRASSVAYNDHSIHIDLAVFYTDMAMYEEALMELQISSRYATDFAMLHNTWGYYYSKIGNPLKAIEAFEKAIDANPERFNTYNNLGLMYLEVGRLGEAREVFRKSLSLNPDQPNLVTFMKTRGL